MSEGAIRVDMTDVKSFDPIPGNWYPLTIVEHEMRKGKASGEPYINWTLEVAEGEYAGRKIWVITSLSKKALFKLKEFLEACDVDAEGEINFDPVDLYNKTILGQVKLEDYEDEDGEKKQRNKCDKFKAL